MCPHPLCPTWCCEITDAWWTVCLPPGYCRPSELTPFQEPSGLWFPNARQREKLMRGEFPGSFQSAFPLAVPQEVTFGRGCVWQSRSRRRTSVPAWPCLLPACRSKEKVENGTWNHVSPLPKNTESTIPKVLWVLVWETLNVFCPVHEENS